MSYPIIFGTLIVRHDSGSLILFERVGCNNDGEGRSSHDWTAKVFSSEEEIRQYAELMKSQTPLYDSFDLRIGTKYRTWVEYGEYLERKLKVAMPVDEFLDRYYFVYHHIMGIKLLDKGIVVSVEDFLNRPKLEPVTYRQVFQNGNIIDRNLIQNIKAGEHLTFYIQMKGTRHDRT